MTRSARNGWFQVVYQTIIETLAFGVTLDVLIAEMSYLPEKRPILRISNILTKFIATIASLVTIGVGILALYESDRIRNFFSVDESPAQEIAVVETIELRNHVRENSFSVTETTSSESANVRQALRDATVQALIDRSFDVAYGDSATRFSIEIKSQYSSEHRDRFNTYVTRCGATVQLTDQIQKSVINQARVAEEGIGGYSVSDNESRCYDILAQKLVRVLQTDLNSI